MANRTKQALSESLKRLMQEKPLEKITIGELAADCGISRMTFYYHFKDIYDLVEWMCIEDLRSTMQNRTPGDTWQDGLLQIFEAAYEQKAYILSLNRAMKREQIEKFWLKQTYDLIRSAVDEQAAGRQIAPEKLDFITEFYKYGFVGILLDWFDQGMKADYTQIVSDISVLMKVNLESSLENFIKANEL